MDKNKLLFIQFLLLIVIILIVYMMYTYHYNKTEQIILLLLMSLFTSIILYYSVYNTTKMSESFTNMEEKNDVYSDINKRENTIKNIASDLHSKLDNTISSIKNIPHNIFTLSSDLLNIYKFISMISKFFLKFNDKIDQLDTTKNELTHVWNDTKKHRDYIKHRVKKNYDLWDKCLVPEGFNKNFNECKTAYEDTKKLENYFKNNYPKFVDYLGKPGGIFEKSGVFDMKDITSILGDNSDYTNYIEKLEKLKG